MRSSRQNRQQLATHRFEITHRLDQMEYGLRRAKSVGEAKAAMDNMFKSKYPLTPELQNRSLASLYLSMYQLLSGTEQQKSEQAMTFIRRLEEAETVAAGRDRRQRKARREAEGADAQADQVDQGAASLRRCEQA